METKFKLGQKVWSIQLGDCEVTNIEDSPYPIRCLNKEGRSGLYYPNGEYTRNDHSPSLFSSNPFFEERVMEVRDFEDDIWVKAFVVSNINKEFQAIGITSGVLNYKFAREISTPQIVELTLKDISEGKGVGVPVELIRIKD